MPAKPTVKPLLPLAALVLLLAACGPKVEISDQGKFICLILINGLIYETHMRDEFIGELSLGEMEGSC